ncbi:MAG: tRNA (adenosine(37)-N6)-threonylcarbamoyltransferase complex ATPase subunit type 1 TsaE [Candidatus Colwellbacteria bacterium]|nr:tRNA (adenosine(37)-N6)-threonylcarbamoyltransferase complex ATPase subunit type 1 TsaE [Candidatus Colwellbacteria bacterium]
MKHLSKNPKETANLAKFFAEELLKTKPGKKALVVGFKGELGAGKTTFIKALLRALGVKGRVVSPTFIFSRQFKSSRGYYKNFFHFDVYRLTSGAPKETKNIGLNEALKSAENLVLVEWADKVKNTLPKGTIWIEFEHGTKSNERYLTFNRR